MNKSVKKCYAMAAILTIMAATPYMVVGKTSSVSNGIVTVTPEFGISAAGVSSDDLSSWVSGDGNALRLTGGALIFDKYDSATQNGILQATSGNIRVAQDSQLTLASSSYIQKAVDVTSLS